MINDSGDAVSFVPIMMEAVPDDVRTGRPDTKMPTTSADDYPSSTAETDTSLYYKLDTIPADKDWVNEVQRNWKPFVVGNRFVLRFPWHTQHDVDEAVRPVGSDCNNDDGDENDDKNESKIDNMVEIELQGGIAFGTGDHPTTQLCLQFLDRVISSRSTTTTTDGEDSSSSSTEHTAIDNTHHELRVIDYGTGSGILGIAACKLFSLSSASSSSPVRRNPSCQAVGIDIDIDACRIANTNAINNNVNMRSYLPPIMDWTDAESKSLLMRAYHTNGADGSVNNENNSNNDLILSPDQWFGGKNNTNNNTGETTNHETQHQSKFDVCVANILAGPLMSLATTFASMLRPGTGVLGMSGILSHQAKDVIDAFQDTGQFDNVRVEREIDGWVLVTATRK